MEFLMRYLMENGNRETVYKATAVAGLSFMLVIVIDLYLKGENTDE